MKKISLILVVIMMISSLSISNALEMGSLKINNGVVSLNQPMVDVDGTVMVPLEEVCTKLGLEVVNEDQNNTVVVTSSDKQYTLNLGSNKINAGNQERYIEQNVTAIEGVVYVPIRFFVDELGYGIEKVSLENGLEVYGLYGSAIHRMNENAYSVEEMVEMAYESSEGLKLLEIAYEQGVIGVDKALESYKGSASGGGGDLTDSNSFSLLSGAISLDQAKVDKEYASKQIKITKDTLENSVYSLVESLKLLIQTNELSEKSLKIAATELEHSRIKNEYGLLGDLDYANLLSSYAQQNSAFEQEQITIANLYESINLIIGEDSSSRYDVNYEPEFATKSYSDAESQLNYTLSIDPVLWKKNEDYRILKRGINYPNYSSGNYYPQSKSNALTAESAKIGIAQYKDGIKSKLQGLYNDMKSYELNNGELLKKLEAAKNDLKKAELAYAVGTGIELDVEKARLQVKSIELELDNNTFGYEKAYREYQRPWLTN